MTQETSAQNIKNRLKSSFKNEKLEELERTPMYGQIYQDLQRPSADKETFLACLCGPGLKVETEILIIAAQDKAFNMRYYQRNMTQPTDSTCRMCCKAERHIKHTVTGCATLALSEHSNRHNHLAG